jgi:hypothetical protein
MQVYPSGGMHKLHAGPYRSREEADQAAARAGQALGFKPFVLSR